MKLQSHLYLLITAAQFFVLFSTIGKICFSLSVKCLKNSKFLKLQTQTTSNGVTTTQDGKLISQIGGIKKTLYHLLDQLKRIQKSSGYQKVEIY